MNYLIPPSRKARPLADLESPRCPAVPAPSTLRALIPFFRARHSPALTRHHPINRSSGPKRPTSPGGTSSGADVAAPATAHLVGVEHHARRMTDGRLRDVWGYCMEQRRRPAHVERAGIGVRATDEPTVRRRVYPAVPAATAQLHPRSLRKPSGYIVPEEEAITREVNEGRLAGQQVQRARCPPQFGQVGASPRRARL